MYFEKYKTQHCYVYIIFWHILVTVSPSHYFCLFSLCAVAQNIKLQEEAQTLVLT